jgi:hypothetical protein
MNRLADGSSTPRTRSGLARSITAGGSSIDPMVFIGASWWLALVAIAVLQQAHEGLHEHLQLPPLLHVVRDGALAVPAAAVALVAGVVSAHSAGGGVGRRQAGERVVFVAVAATAFAVLSVPGNQLHGALFGAEEEGLSFLADTLLDGGLAFIGALLALIPFGLVIGLPTAVPTDPLVPEPSRGHRPGPGDVVARSSK